MPMIDDMTFGYTLTIVGMTGTLVSLWVLSLLISLLKKVCPIEPASGSSSRRTEK